MRTGPGKEHSPSAWTKSCTGNEQKEHGSGGSTVSRWEYLGYPYKRGREGGTTFLVMGLVFKTSRAAARVVAGGFDSHVPPPSFSDRLSSRAGEGSMMRNNEFRDGLLGRVLMRLNETGADRMSPPRQPARRIRDWE